DNREGLTPQQLTQAAAGLGFDPAELTQQMEDPLVSTAVVVDAQTAKRLGVRFIPWVYINRKWVPRWRLEGHDVIGDMFDQAATMRRLEP
ncbi:MAG: DsbA family protein, partial [Planctomycetota bacterium]